jgi:hypothetical protein
MVARLPITPCAGSNCGMNLLRHFGILSLVFLASARADLTIVQKVESANGSNRITLKVKGDKARVEVNPQITTIIDTKTGDLTTLLNDKKAAMHISGDKAKAMAEMARSLIKDQSTEKATPHSTGRKEMIGGYETEEYVSDTVKYHTTYWIAKSYPDYQNILQQMAVLQNGAFATVSKSMPDYNALPGLPLRTRMKLEGQSEMTSTIDSVSRNPIADSEFSIPANYSELKMPDFLGGKQSPAKPGQTGQE